MSKLENINIQIHPRAFAAFGEDLVTNDMVAVIELVKNAYDAYAFNVLLEFGTDEQGENYIAITDDGLGMNRDIILGAWATIATPYKKKNPVVEREVDGKIRKRVVSGNKGLGRFSAARLGDEMTMVTKSKNEVTLKAFFDWRLFENVEDINECFMTLEEVENTASNETGTTIVIKKLKSNWNEEKINDLVSELSRLITPFETISDFNIEIDSPYKTVKKLIVKPKDFIEKPIYKIYGDVLDDGSINYTYEYDNGIKQRRSADTIVWTLDNYKESADLLSDKKLLPYTCGEFSFELRVWDLDAESIQEIADRFNIKKKRDIRNNISLYKGISVYRDDVLVLPKSEASRDWLGLDAKRISQIGRRISTSQIVGIVHVSNEKNPEIKDTTDREKLADTMEYKQFVDVIHNIVEALQRERLLDKVEEKTKGTLTDIIAPLSANELLENVEAAASKGAGADDILEFVRDYQQKNEKQLKELNDRLIYYAQTASLGSVAIVIMHEFLTGMTCIKRFMNKAKQYLVNYDSRTVGYLEDAQNSHKRIVEVTQSFAPLYKRDLRTQNHRTNLKDTIDKTVRLIKAKKSSSGVSFNYLIPEEIITSISESELQTIFINLFDNSCYWMKDVAEDKREILINIEERKQEMLTLTVSDTGSGIEPEDAEKIFVPGVTAKPKGIGMGLVIITEIVKSYDGAIGVRIPGDKNGATFVLEIPIRKE